MPSVIFASAGQNSQGLVTLEFILLISVIFLGSAAVLPLVIPLLKPLVHRLTNVKVLADKDKNVSVDVKLVPANATLPSSKIKRLKDPEKTRRDVRRTVVERKQRANKIPIDPPEAKPD